jgi:hypothetical protein
MLKHLKKLAIAGMLAATLAGCGKTQQQRADIVGKAMEAALPKDFAKLVFEENHAFDAEKPASALVYKGSNATLLMVEKPRLEGHLSPYVRMAGLAVTKNGRYFEFTYRSFLDSDSDFPASLFESVPCTEDACRGFTDNRGITPDMDKLWVFNSDSFTPERYRWLFREDAPPKRVPA